MTDVQQAPLAERVQKAMIGAGGFTAWELSHVMKALTPPPPEPPPDLGMRRVHALSSEEARFLIRTALQRERCSVAEFSRALQELEAQYRRLTWTDVLVPLQISRQHDE